MNPVIIRCLIIGVAGLCFTACGIYRETVDSSSSTSESPALISVHTGETGMNVREILFTVHNRWEGTPYLIGGSSTSGVDCSAFIQIVYRDFFDLHLPRHTRDQLRAGSGIRRNQIRPGDLVFFRTGRGILHVGIAMDDGDFLHASVSSGVMISNIAENYWANRYLGARRILD